ncbi:hypothetical protein OESDEN_21734 [Oesophagostomum dentatum]|uniref:Uncharacterized protein n=1 Tax=Oesophagostomum dentatum TaxID=61180 RepID=A0A0B1S012_OESDE|nr:hypothetical protein OESDEN_21734 [Oesophagostomum dentatum]
MPSEAYEGTYRPVPEGKSLKLPFTDDTRPADRLVGQALGLGRGNQEIHFFVCYVF